jgi:phosphoribosyl-ATP pyrophosphohydrolase/phosphoribosyl-AMP cyclohydrolase
MNIDFSKHPDGLVPAIVQDAQTKTVLMLGYMNADAVAKTEATQQVTFYSRSKNRLWTKGEESGNVLELVSISVDCDKDALLVKAMPKGPTCHTGSDSCWNEENTPSYGLLSDLETIISDRKNKPTDKSYVASLFAKGINKIAQKVGEEAVEVVIEAKDNDESLFLNESADLVFHLLILLQAKGYKLQDVVDVLEARQNNG